MSSSPGTSDLLLLLKEGTAQQHQNLEKDLDLLGPAVDRVTYCDLLRRFLSVYSAWEPFAAGLLAADFPSWAAERSRVGLIRQDLAELGCDAGTPDRAVAFPGVTDVASALGAMYVLEGSTLGSQILIRHFEKTLGITPTSGGAFYYGYGLGTGRMWREFTAAIQEYAERTGSHSRIVEGAKSMFEIMHRELCGVHA